MSIIRGPRPDVGFYTVSKDISEDRRLSWGARGLLIFLLGKPDHWKVSVAHLITQTEQCLGVSSGRDAVRGLLKELVQAGYVRAAVAHGDGGRFEGMDYVVSEIAQPPKAENPATESPGTDNPATAKPATANPHLVKNDKKVKKEEEAKNQLNKKARTAKSAAPADKAARKTALPDDFAPTEQHRAIAQDAGLDLQRELEQFKDHHTAAASHFADWNAALRTWLRNAIQWRGRVGVGQAPKNRTQARKSAANGKLLDGQGQPKNYTAGVDDDGFAKL